MPETRKFEGSTSDPIQAAIREAMGESVRPNEPGAKPSEKARPVAPVVSTIGTFTFTATPASKPKPAAASDDESE